MKPPALPSGFKWSWLCGSMSEDGSFSSVTCRWPSFREINGTFLVTYPNSMGGQVLLSVFMGSDTIQSEINI